MSLRWLALDVGGANLKGAHADGPCRSRSFAVWRHPEALPDALGSFVAGFLPFDAVALTLTAELCDCFATKAEGVNAVLSAVEHVAAGRPVTVWGLDGGFHEIEEIRREPSLAASANWLALATFAADAVPEGAGLLIDVGSTTTDLIPLAAGRPRPRGRSDSERLRTGELIYAGVMRTTVCALATELTWRGASTGLAAELFATTLDVYLTLGAISPNPDDRDTADGRPATVEAARDRLARMVGADRDGFSALDAVELAAAADAALVGRLVEAARRVCPERPDAVVVSGSGESLARRVAEAVLGSGGSIRSLGERFGASGSEAACAVALLDLVNRQELRPRWLKSRS